MLLRWPPSSNQCDHIVQSPQRQYGPKPKQEIVYGSAPFVPVHSPTNPAPAQPLSSPVHPPPIPRLAPPPIQPATHPSQTGGAPVLCLGYCTNCAVIVCMLISCMMKHTNHVVLPVSFHHLLSSCVLPLVMQALWRFSSRHGFLACHWQICCFWLTVVPCNIQLKFANLHFAPSCAKIGHL